jgi:hypothetical protein
MSTETKISSNTLTWDEFLALNLKGHLIKANEDGIVCFGRIEEVEFGQSETIILHLKWIKFQGREKVFGYKYCIPKNQTPTQTGRIIRVAVTGVRPRIPILILAQPK